MVDSKADFCPPSQQYQALQSSGYFVDPIESSSLPGLRPLIHLSGVSIESVRRMEGKVRRENVYMGARLTNGRWGPRRVRGTRGG